MTIYDSVQKTKLRFEPQVEGKVSLYVCGPTVYDDAHLGHAKSALVFDLLRRVLEAEGYEVTFARNITDIDDKIINKAIESGLSTAEIAERYTQAYHRDMASIGVRPPTLEPKATESIGAMSAMIQKLLDTGHAYRIANGDIYFDTQSDGGYLSLSNRQSSENVSRVEKVSEKRHEADFALWKAVNDDGVAFDSPFGPGRPGWHLECSAMIESYLAREGTPYAIDIHGGGADLLFPHHENEAAQTRCATNRELARYWMHNGFVTIGGEKMSKSLGNSFFLKDALRAYNGEVIRFYLLSTHYRGDFNFNEEDLIAAKKRLDRLYRLKKRLFGMSGAASNAAFKSALLEALGDDLNVSKAYALIDELIAAANEKLDTDPKDKAYRQNLLGSLAVIEEVMGFGAQNPYEYFQFGLDEATKAKIDALIERRGEAKKIKDFTASDAIRDELVAMGVMIMDTPSGTFWEMQG
ncbi:cysteine--tRNA ligase [Sulfuricurvum sp. IAE1]|jgi:cysteinyl-tRNA synthetase|uniref:cysteine--tRNA ligase n=1 Tax=Sulfuricurvum sp. IAE1 TaxID=2546102 RepID=UPI001046B6D7|nr:cysteine--tRNA ligase [Sulfuricurvum sp. IAE1]MDX9965785.1 cysteine--tRNA ligase [Sulfuricurvum sp.]TDA69026.1 cysteine--tRNA ligase [Sulfuricurvum sp. IAE1]